MNDEMQDTYGGISDNYLETLFGPQQVIVKRAKVLRDKWVNAQKEIQVLSAEIAAKDKQIAELKETLRGHLKR